MRPQFPPEFEPEPLEEARWLNDGGPDLVEEPDEPQVGDEPGRPAPIPTAS